ncbi:MAG: UDP-N-acetylmuramoyl-tripeptide--D-alanyl-D-alanine ligase [Deltaproteobacteria bacterium]|jgi:UDP-N-acetylmuramoyl-tripeptide--D-alanyl-D-alanine ligase|nr:UDP-N-acetylmuramoyl-tripeptide--D-alanyl-D-alanine ligase [Deltaproteobacteria bacterium]
MGHDFFEVDAPGGLTSGPGLGGFGLALDDVAAFCRGGAAGRGGDGRRTGGAGRRTGGAVPVTSVTLDSRLAGPGSVFVALKGEARDGHEFVPMALGGGALAAVVGRDHRAGDAGEDKLVRVDDTLKALGRLAAAVRVKSGALVAAVTGSVGKTTVKEFLRHIFASYLSPEEFHFTKGNFNNHVGLPLTLLSLTPKTRVAVVEMGAGGFGEVAELTAMARPDVGLVTGAAEAHLEFFGSVEGVARAKGELYRGLPEGAVAVVNASDGLMVAQSENFFGNKLFFGLGPAVEKAPDPARGPGRDAGKPRVLVEGVVDGGLAGQTVTLSGPGLDGTISARLSLPGRHNALNAAAAAAAALAAGAGWPEIKAGLEAARSFPGRLRVREAPGGLRVVDDCYNANPGSMAAALEFLGTLAGASPVGAILGDMLALGEFSEERHLRLGRQAARAGLSLLALVGEMAPAVARGVRSAGESGGGSVPEGMTRIFESPVEAARWARSAAPPGAVVLVKASRDMGLEAAVMELVGN